MKTIFKFFVIILFALMLAGGFGLKTHGAELNTLLFFESEGCSHCEEEAEFLDELQIEHPDLQIERYEVSKNRLNQAKLTELSQRLGFNPNGVPITIYGDDYVIGFTGGGYRSKN